MSKINRRSFIGNTNSEENARILADPNASYRLMYWKAASVGASARDMLAYGKAKWTNELVTIETWESLKPLTPFGYVPLLKIASSDGKETFLAESIVVDHFLAKRFGLLGDNEWEEFTVKGIYNNIHYFRERAFMTVIWTFEDKRKAAMEKFIKETVPAFIADHEFHLKANGSNGHYIGNKGPLIKAEFEKSEELMRVRKNVEQNPDIAAWRNSEEWAMLVQGSLEGYAHSAAPEDQ
ncbi:Glutathione S-transferase S1 [Haplosporangium sp. Z 27]|nr:Glutathione S-transferase S1 [Haplosporangium sp. Z 27]